jgi:hypothetical protein
MVRDAQPIRALKVEKPPNIVCRSLARSDPKSLNLSRQCVPTSDNSTIVRYHKLCLGKKCIWKRKSEYEFKQAGEAIDDSPCFS